MRTLAMVPCFIHDLFTKLGRVCFAESPTETYFIDPHLETIGKVGDQSPRVIGGVQTPSIDSDFDFDFVYRVRQ